MVKNINPKCYQNNRKQGILLKESLVQLICKIEPLTSQFI